MMSPRYQSREPNSRDSNKSTADSCLVIMEAFPPPFCKHRRREWFSATKQSSIRPSLMHSLSRYLLFFSRSVTYSFFLSLDLTAASLFLTLLNNHHAHSLSKILQNYLKILHVKEQTTRYKQVNGNQKTKLQIHMNNQSH